MENKSNIIYTSPEIKSSYFKKPPKRILIATIIFIMVGFIIAVIIYFSRGGINQLASKISLQKRLENIQVIDIDQQFKEVNQTLQKL